MKDLMTESPRELPFTSAEWDRLRYQMQDSMMADTSLAKLALNLGTKWPIRGRDECPRKYLGYQLEALAELPEFFGKGNRLAQLYSILKETQALDDPFNDMVGHFDKVAGGDNEAVRALQSFEVPEDYPIELTHFSKATRALCKTEGVQTLRELIDFTQRCAQRVFLGGEFQAFLNALVQRDAEVLKSFLPIREGRPGLSLAEGLGQYVSRLGDPEAATLLATYQLSFDRPSWKKASALSKAETAALLEGLRETVEPYFQIMPEQAQELRHAVDSGLEAAVRYFAPIGEPDTETLARAAAMAAFGVKPRNTSFLKRIIPG
jgi:hypothetical protein